MGLGKILRKNYPTNQVEVLQILSNAGVPTKVTIRDLNNDVLAQLQILWQKDLTQKDLRYGLKFILGKLEIVTDIEMAVISIHREIRDVYGMINEAVDILEPNKRSLKETLSKWQMIKSWNLKDTTNQWLKYDRMDPKCQLLNSNWTPYNVIQEFNDNNNLIRTIELTIWNPEDIDKHIGDIKFDRKDRDIKIRQGNY